MPIACSCQAVVFCGVNCGCSTDTGCPSNTPAYFTPMTANRYIYLKDMILGISGGVGGLRQWIAYEYARRNLAVGAWTDPSLSAGSSNAKYQHFYDAYAKIVNLTNCRCNCNRGASGGCTCNSNNYNNYYVK